MRHSFRLRLILLSVGVSGLVLAVFAVSAWAFVRRIGLQKIDRDMGQRMWPQIGVSRPPEAWAWVAGLLKLSYGGEGGGECIVLVKGTDGQVLHRSPDWPDALTPGRFPVPSPTNPRLLRFPPPPAPPAAPRAPAGAGAAPKEALPAAPPLEFLPAAPPQFATHRAGGRSWRVGTIENSQATLVVGVSLARLDAEMARVRTAFLGASPVALLFIALGSWLVSRRALRSVEDLANVAERVTASSLDQRIPEEGVETEFRRLISVFNGMLDRLERSFSQAVRFSADAAHELRTPLTILQGEVEQALQEAPDGSEQQRVYNGLLEEVQRLKAITQKLLLLSQADSGQLRPALKPVDLTGLVRDAVEDAETLAPHLSVTEDLAPNVQVMADRDLLQQALTNLSSNAAKYNREGGSIEFRLTSADGWAEIAITNTGPGIPPDDHGRLFERFYRADPSRGRRVDGVGLGLSLAREIVRAHGGDVALVESRDDHTSFRITLPLGVAGTDDASAPA